MTPPPMMTTSAEVGRAAAAHVNVTPWASGSSSE